MKHENCGCTRRDFLQFGFSGLAIFALSRGLPFPFAQDSKSDGTGVQKTGKAKKAICIWLDGGPSQIDTFDPKPGKPTGGEFKAIESSQKGIYISETLPNLAKVMNKASIIRTLNSNEAEHLRAKYLLHTGFTKRQDVTSPAAGSVIAFESGEPIDNPLYVVLGNGSYGNGYLPPEYAPFTVNNAQKVLQIINASGAEKERLKLLDEFNAKFEKSRMSESLVRRDTQYELAEKLKDSKFAKALDLSLEKKEVVNQYGLSDFGNRCLIARRLIENGTKFVEVQLGGWDTHENNFARVKNLCQNLDVGLAALINDLDRRGLLKETIVLCLGEFGRTPKINGRNGRDHFSRAFSCFIAGGGIQPGRIYGETNDDGTEIKRNPVTIPDLFATLYAMFGIDPDKKYYSNNTGVQKVTNGGKIINDLIS